MNIKVVLFDLDGTLLPMDQDQFTKGYFKLLVKKMIPYGYDSEQLIEAIWTGTAAMVQNDGKETNETIFWRTFAKICGEHVLKDKALFESFYKNEFQEAKAFCGYNPKVPEVIQKVKDLGLRMALTTNPIFPAIATESRIRWAGVKPEDFEIYTTYENIGFCKPNPQYYQEILNRLNVKAEECLLIGNDVTEDMIVKDMGMHVFLLTDCLINKKEKDITQYPHGDFNHFLQFIGGEKFNDKINFNESQTK